MKKQIASLMMATLMFTFSIVSCHKQTPLPSVNQVQQNSSTSATRIHTKAELFNAVKALKEKHNVLNIDMKVSPQQASKIIVADAGGCISGGRYGSYFGWVGILVGAAIVGGASSYFASQIAVPNDNIFDNIAGYNAVYMPELDGYGVNPYDQSVGVQHNVKLQALWSENIQNPNADWIDLWSNIDLTNDEVAFIEQNKVKYQTLRETIDDNTSVQEHISIMGQEIGTSTLEYELFSDVMSTIASMDTEEQILAYIIDYEKLIDETDASLFDTNGKDLIFMGLSTAKYSNHFWHSVI